jgi:translation initiation factor IF-3
LNLDFSIELEKERREERKKRHLRQKLGLEFSTDRIIHDLQRSIEELRQFLEQMNK